MSVAPHTDTQVARVAPVSLQTLPGCIAKPPTCQYGEESRLAWCLGPGVDMHMADVLVFWIVTVCAGGSDIDFGRWLGFAFGLGRFKDYGEALAGRRRNALRRRLLVVDGVMTRMLGAKEIHDGNEIR
jgi:hypothetical protein